MLMWIELAVVCASALLAFPCAKFNPRWATAAECAFSRFAQHKNYSVLLVGLLALLARPAILPLLPQPEPSINDEFAHLLGADTFAHGRLTNPPHPMWIHFETFHEIQKPTFSSMYPPAQGLILGLGQAITGNPFVGVCLSVALLCASLCWMLQGWTTPAWALFGGLLAIIRFGIFSYWANSYWGGAMGAIGGALVLGALPRVIRSCRPVNAALMGIGLAILGNSRPYEGFLLSIPVAIVLIAWLVRQFKSARWLSALRVVLPLAMVLSTAAIATGYYFWRVTGSPMRMPQIVSRETYAVAPYFLWQEPRPQPVYRHEVMRNFYLHNELDFYKQHRCFTGIVALTIVKFFDIWLFYIGPTLTVPLVLACFSAPKIQKWGSVEAETRFLLTTSGVWFVGLGLEAFFLPHYAAPVLCVLFALVFRSMADVRSMVWRGRPVGVYFTRIVPLACLFLLALRGSVGLTHIPITPDWPPMWYNATPPKTARARVLGQLESLPGKQLALVRYAEHPKSGYEWVYNRADVDAAKVVWARDMGHSGNQELLSYYRDRSLWLVEPEKEGQELSPYERPHSAVSNSELR
jgi:hypothetical protein